MKKITALVLVCSLILTACKDGKQTVDRTTTASTTAEEIIEEAAEDEPLPEDYDDYLWWSKADFTDSEKCRNFLLDEAKWGEYIFALCGRSGCAETIVYENGNVSNQIAVSAATLLLFKNKKLIGSAKERIFGEKYNFDKYGLGRTEEELDYLCGFELYDGENTYPLFMIDSDYGLMNKSYSFYTIINGEISRFKEPDGDLRTISWYPYTDGMELHDIEYDSRLKFSFEGEPHFTYGSSLYSAERITSDPTEDGYSLNFDYEVANSGGQFAIKDSAAVSLTDPYGKTAASERFSTILVGAPTSLIHCSDDEIIVIFKKTEDIYAGLIGLYAGSECCFSVYEYSSGVMNCIANFFTDDIDSIVIENSKLTYKSAETVNYYTIDLYSE